MKARDNFLKPNINISNQTKNTQNNNTNDIVTLNYFKNMVNNNTLSNNSYSVNNKKAKKRLGHTRKSKDSPIMSIPSEVPNVESEERIGKIFVWWKEMCFRKY